MSRCEVCTRPITRTTRKKGAGGRPGVYCSRKVCRETVAARVRWERCWSEISYPDTAAGRAAHKANHSATMKAIQKGMYGTRTMVAPTLTADEGAALYPPEAREPVKGCADCIVCARPTLTRAPGSRGRPPCYCEHRGACCEARSALPRPRRCLRLQTFPATPAGQEASDRLRSTLLAAAWSIYDDHRAALDAA